VVRLRLNWSYVACVLLILIGTLRIISTYTVFNHTIDEPDHLAAGMEWLDGRYFYEDQHPPLARVFGAMLPYLAGERWRRGPESYSNGYRILGHGAHYDCILALGRAGELPFFWLASAVVFLWAYRAAGPAAGVIATLLFTTLPPILAHSALITTDMALAALTGAAAYLSIGWAESPSRRRTAAFGIVLGLAVLSKFSALVFLPAAWVAMCAFQRPPWKEIKRRGRPALEVLAIAALVVWAGYLFSFARVDFLHLRLPAPRFFTGLHAVWAHDSAGHSSYLLGQRGSSGFWYYYPVVLALKTPLAMLALCGVALAFGKRKGMALPVAFSLGILAVVSVSRINIGVRHVLPIYIGLAVVCGIGAATLLERRAPIKLALQVLLAWQVFSSAEAHPDYLAYTNEIAGEHPENFLADSDLDWGQDMKRLGVFLKTAGASQVTFVPFNKTYPLAGHPFPAMLPGETGRPSPGWNAVSISIWKIFGYPQWADEMKRPLHIGRSILVWYVPPGQ
jgi:hypothetical protein